MQLSLTIAESAILPADILQRFISDAKKEGRTAEQKLCDLITQAVQPKRVVKKGGLRA